MTTWVCLRWQQQQDQLVGLMRLDRQISRRTPLDRGDREAALAEVKRRLPGAVVSVNSFGRNEQTVPILHRVRALSRETGDTVPAEVQAVLSALGSRASGRGSPRV